MKKIKFILFLAGAAVILQSCTGNNKVEIGNKTSMKVDLIYDAGKVIQGEVIDATFTVENTGDYPLVIGDVKGSCSCTVVEKPEDPIAPRETGAIKAHVTTQTASPGVIAKTVNIVANTEPSRTEVIVKATIIKK